MPLYLLNYNILLLRAHSWIFRALNDALLRKQLLLVFIQMIGYDLNLTTKSLQKVFYYSKPKQTDPRRRMQKSM